MMNTPCRRVTATAMFPVLNVDKLEVNFTASPFNAGAMTDVTHNDMVNILNFIYNHTISLFYIVLMVL